MFEDEDRAVLHGFRELLKEVLEVMTANDTALAGLEAAVAANTDATNAVIALLGEPAGTDDISAGVDAATATVEANTAALTSASTPAPSDSLSFTPGASISTALGQPASFSVGTITGGTPPYTVNGLPDGLTADGGGNVSGTPTGTGTSTLTVSDSAGNSASGSVTLTVA